MLHVCEENWKWLIYAIVFVLLIHSMCCCDHEKWCHMNLKIIINILSGNLTWLSIAISSTWTTIGHNTSKCLIISHFNENCINTFKSEILSVFFFLIKNAHHWLRNNAIWKYKFLMNQLFLYNVRPSTLHSAITQSFNSSGHMK